MREANFKIEEKPNVLIIERVFDAPQERVWKAWTDPEQVVKWWGPNGFTTPVYKADFQVGSAFHFCMRSPDGNDFWCGGIYQEIVENERIVCTDYFADEQGNKVSPEHYGMSPEWPAETIITVTFENVQGKTKLTVIQESVTPSKKRECAEQGWSESLDRLAIYVEQA